MITKRIGYLCSEDPSLIENYEEAAADTEVMWHVHHRREISEDGHIFYNSKQLKAMGQYYHCPAADLIFLRPEDHMNLHWQEEQKRLIGDSQSRSWTPARRRKLKEKCRKKRDEQQNLVNIPQLESDKDYRDYQRVYKTHWYNLHREEWNEYNYRVRLAKFSDEKLESLLDKHTRSVELARDLGRKERVKFLKKHIEYIREELEKRDAER